MDHGENNPAITELKEDHRELETVFDTHEESEAMVVRGLLESAGIAAVTASLEAPQDILPGVGGVAVRVRPDQAEEARRVIEEYRAADGAVEEATDLDEPPAG